MWDATQICTADIMGTSGSLVNVPKRLRGGSVMVTSTVKTSVGRRYSVGQGDLFRVDQIILNDLDS